MKRVLSLALALPLLVACPPEGPRQPHPIGSPEPLASFAPENDSTIGQTGISPDAGGWRIEAVAPGSIPLFEVTHNLCQSCRIDYHARLKSRDLAGKAYLELWVRLPGKGEFFSRGLASATSGTRDWQSAEAPFFLMAGQRPDLVRVNLRIEGAGTVWIKDITLDQTPLAEAP